MREPCKYATASVESYEYRTSAINRGSRKIENPPRDLCAWAHFHPQSADKLKDVPPHVSRNALAGHLMLPRDCEHCHCYEAGDPVE